MKRSRIRKEVQAALRMLDRVSHHPHFLTNLPAPQELEVNFVGPPAPVTPSYALGAIRVDLRVIERELV